MVHRVQGRGIQLHLRGGTFPIALLSCTLWLGATLWPAHGASAPPPSVTIATVQRSNVAPSHSFIGRVIAIQSAQIVPRVTAFIDAVPVKQGSDVKSGDVIYQLQKSQYEAAVQAAQAQLASAQAGLKNDQVAYERASRLNNQGFEAQSNLDSALATRDQARAAVLSAQANLAQAALNLSYCTIRSPIDGRIGAVTLTKGNLVTPTTPALAAVNQLDPIRVVFSVADSDLVRVEQKTGHTQGEITNGLVVNLRLPDGSEYNQVGKIAFLGNQVDQQTGTVAIYADFANPQHLLLPGGFVTVEVRQAKPEMRVLVPVVAVQIDQKGSYVLIVGAGNKVAQQPITTAQQMAQNFVVTKGLGAGDRVIVAGVQKVQPGEVVNPIPAPVTVQQNGSQATAQAGQGD
ncbi:MAG TPA: efflux RND transporter periplasmic adaptor subunit [Acetobacteraceae bacterium]|nr:efflux RND transporter periplasmic adaptor subunit [Acetobacteraceae bacterium]